MYFSQRRNAAAARAFFERAIATTGVRPTRVTTDKAKCFPPALRATLPNSEHRCTKYLNNGMERDHGHLKQRLRPLSGFKQATSADTFARGHALIRNLQGGFSVLTAAVPRPLHLAAAWPQLAAMISAAPRLICLPAGLPAGLPCRCPLRCNKTVRDARRNSCPNCYAAE